MIYIFLIVLGLVPSIIWLLFYLRKDAHPESRQMIIKVFLYGMIAAVAAALLELGIAKGLRQLNISPIFLRVIYIFIGIALVEELSKYLIVREKVFKNAELDEPLDIMLYMVISALGFAALENILVLLPLGSPFNFFETLSIIALRFIGATFLHALCSGTFGYFIALSLNNQKNRLKLFSTGITIATLLHGVYNSFIMRIEESVTIRNGITVVANPEKLFSSIIFLIIILIGLAVLVSWEFKKLKKLKSVCLPKFN